MKTSYSVAFEKWWNKNFPSNTSTTKQFCFEAWEAGKEFGFDDGMDTTLTMGDFQDKFNRLFLAKQNQG